MERESSGERLDIVYVGADAPGGALFVRREMAKRAAQICRAVKTSTTWGQFRKAMPAEELKEIEDLRDDVAPDDAPFSPDDIWWGDDGWSPGPWPPEDVFDWLDCGTWEEFGCELEPNPNGESLFIPPESVEKIIRVLRAQGHHVEESVDDLPYWINSM